METSQTDLAEQRVALRVIEKVHIGKHEGVSPVCTVLPAETPPLYFICRNWLGKGSLYSPRQQSGLVHFRCGNYHTFFLF